MAKIFFYILLVPIFLISLIPLRVLYVLSDILAFVLEKIIGYRSYVIYINLARSFPQKKYNELKKIAHVNYRLISDNFVETIWAISSSFKKISKLAHIENPEVLKEIYDSGKNAIVVLGHKSNWELLGSFDIFAHGKPLGFTNKHLRFLYKKAKNRTFDMLTYWVRNKHSLATLIESDSAPRYMISHRNERNLYFLIADQSPPRGAKFAVDFLNQTTLMINGPEQLSKLLDYPVVYLDMEKRARGKYIIRLTKITDKPKEEPDGYITGKFAQLMEKDIIKNPSSWLWSHKRWKRNLEENIKKHQ